MTFILAGCQKPSSAKLYTVRGDAIERPLTTQLGNIERGELIFTARDRGHCVLCHQISGLKAEFQGNIGPDLTDVAERFSQGQIRLRIADYEAVKPRALMPSYYRKDGLRQIPKDLQGQTLLSGQDIEDLIAYLAPLNLQKKRALDE